ncbi:MAG: zf-HC2 domain-containing protein [Planctomycetota bacterium]
MLTCDEIELELSAYCDGELPPAERVTVESHLAMCAACKTSVEEIERVRTVLNMLQKVAAPARAKAASRAAVEAELKSAPKPIAASVTPIQRGRRSNGWMLFASAAAAVMISALGYVSFFRSSIPTELDNAPVAFKVPSDERKREARGLERAPEELKPGAVNPVGANDVASIHPDGGAIDYPEARPVSPVPVRKSTEEERARTLALDAKSDKSMSSTTATPMKKDAAFGGPNKDGSNTFALGGGASDKNAGPVFKQQDAVALKKAEAQRPLSPPAPAPFATAPSPQPIAPKGESDKGGEGQLRTELLAKAKAAGNSIIIRPMPKAVHNGDVKEGGDAAGREAGNGLPSAKKSSRNEELEALQSGTKIITLQEDRKAPQKPGNAGPVPPTAAFPVPSADRPIVEDAPVGASNRRASAPHENTQLFVVLRGTNLLDLADSIRQRVLSKDKNATFLEAPLVPYPTPNSAVAAYAVTISTAQTDAVMSALESMQSTTKPAAKKDALAEELSETQNEQLKKLAAPRGEKRTGRVTIRIEIVIEK